MAQKSKGFVEGIGVVNIVAMAIVIILFGAGGHFLGKNVSNTKTEKQVAAAQVVSYDGQDGKNALDILKEKADIKVQDSSIGTFVLSINGTSNSEDHYWMFYVNDELSPFGADQYQTKGSDKIEWRYEAIL